MHQGAGKLSLKPDGIGGRGGRGSGWFQAVGWLIGGCSAGSNLRSQGDSLSDAFALRARGFIAFALRARGFIVGLLRSLQIDPAVHRFTLQSSDP